MAQHTLEARGAVAHVQVVTGAGQHEYSSARLLLHAVAEVEGL